ncbi:MAG: helix-turn-helix transcriptional regulator [Chloroflexota bacterium]|nr:helix-turn-helix transcriptional regulator [Chloroflexota bacterium]
MNDDHQISAFCPIYHRAIELIGRRWTGAILRVLLSGQTRFSDVTAAIPGLSDRLLSERLKELEAEGIVTRTVIPETPVRIEYRLTEKGRALSHVINAVSEWAGKWLGPHGAAPPEPEAAPAGDGRVTILAGRS